MRTPPLASRKYVREPVVGRPQAFAGCRARRPTPRQGYLLINKLTAWPRFSRSARQFAVESCRAAADHGPGGGDRGRRVDLSVGGTPVGRTVRPDGGGRQPGLGTYFNSSFPSRPGVVGVCGAPHDSSLLGLGFGAGPVIAPGTPRVVLTSYELPLPAVSLCECWQRRTFPGGW